MDARHLLQHVVAGGPASLNILTLHEAHDVMGALLRGDFNDAEMTALLQAYHLREVTAPELAGFAEAMRSAAVTLPLTDAERERLVDTCGTGGDGSGSFNISTAAALVAAAAGAMVAKHGNRAVTSRCGSADVLEALGIRIDHTPESAAESLRQHGFAFLLATHMHPAMKIVAPVRRALPHRTVFNLLGPMTNPAGARRQLLGVYASHLVPVVAQALAHGGSMRRALVVHGADGLDELSLSGVSVAGEVNGTVVSLLQVLPANAGVAMHATPLPGGGAAANAAILQRIFAGGAGPERDIVTLNAAAALLVADVARDLVHGATLARDAIDSGAAAALVERLQHS